MSVKDMLTENDNTTACIVRGSACAILVGFLAGVGYDTVHNGVFNFPAYASAAWPLLLAIGGAVAGKAFVETRKDAQ